MKKEQLITNINNKESRCMVLQKNGTVLNYSKLGGIYAAKDLFNNYNNELKDSFVAINLLSRATAAFLIKGQIANIYAYKLSRHAIELLEEYKIEYSYGELVEHITNSDKTDMCPFEKMSLDKKSANDIVNALLISL